jgi:hypothetical protein
MKPAPQRPGESAADFKARVKAANDKWLASQPKPKPKPVGSSPVRVMPGKTPMRVTGGMGMKPGRTGMKSGGMVKGKK